MDKKLKQKWEEAIESLECTIAETKVLGLENTQEALNYIDRVNRLSVEF